MKSFTEMTPDEKMAYAGPIHVARCLAIFKDGTKEDLDFEDVSPENIQRSIDNLSKSCLTVVKLSEYEYQKQASTKKYVVAILFQMCEKYSAEEAVAHAWNAFRESAGYRQADPHFFVTTSNDILNDHDAPTITESEAITLLKQNDHIWLAPWLRDEDGELIMMAGCVDITESNRSAREFKESADSLKKQFGGTLGAKARFANGMEVDI